MARLETGKIRDGPHHMIILCDDYPVFDPVAQAIGGRLRHLPGRLAGGHQEHTSREFPVFQGTLHRRVGLYRGDGFPDNLVRMVPQLLIQFQSLPVFDGMKGNITGKKPYGNGGIILPFPP